MRSSPTAAANASGARPARTGGRRTSLPLAFFAFLYGACATAGPSPAEVPAPEAETPEASVVRERAADPLEPPQAAVRAARRTSLTGRETGTMWTFENPPLAYWDSAYGFQPEEGWLDHVRLSSVRFGEICSASFVSRDGLAMTNHHCARSCGEALSGEETDLVEAGFLAGSRADELVCPNLWLDQLLSIEDVTERVRAAAPARGPAVEIAEARAAEREAIERKCETDTGHACEVVSLYQGGQYQLYTYRRYEPVTLVFLPELQAGFFGGDPDNFTYPRHALDVAFVRAYEADDTASRAVPASTPHHFAWRGEGAREGEPVFLTGNPGSTSRLITVSRLLYERAFRHPFIVQLLDGQREVLGEIAARGPEAERAVRDQLFGVENSLKAFEGQLDGLLDTLLIGQKLRWEEEFRSRIEGREETRRAFGDVWERLAGIQARKLRLSPRVNVNDFEFLGGPYERLAGALVLYSRERDLPAEARSEEFRGEAAEELAQLLLQPARPDREIATRLLALRLEIADRWLAPDDPFRAVAFQEGEGPADAARRLVAGTHVDDVEFRRRAMEAGPEAIAISGDPLLRLASAMYDALRELRPRWEETLAAETAEEERLAEALFATFGTTLPPDATFTLRISDGEVRRYPYNGTVAPAVTTFHGLYERAAAFQEEGPWSLPTAFRGRERDLDLSTPLNFVTTNDITGGNSGSPVIDREARIVGVAFDGNIEQLPNEFLFRTESARTVAVHAAGILEALRVIYGAQALVDELLGQPAEVEEPVGEPVGEEP